MEEKLKLMLTEKRFEHSIGVMETAVKLARLYGVNEKKARFAGLLHDCAKNISHKRSLDLCKKYQIELNDIELANHSLIHAPLGAKLAEVEFGITDEEILHAISTHTVGGAGMTDLDKIIYLADMIEPGRCFEGVEKHRKLAFKNLDRAFLYALDESIIHNIKKGVLLHPGTVIARNELLLKNNSKRK